MNKIENTIHIQCIPSSHDLKNFRMIKTKWGAIFVLYIVCLRMWRSRWYLLGSALLFLVVFNLGSVQGFSRSFAKLFFEIWNSQILESISEEISSATPRIPLQYLLNLSRSAFYATRRFDDDDDEDDEIPRACEQWNSVDNEAFAKFLENQFKDLSRFECPITKVIIILTN